MERTIASTDQTVSRRFGSYDLLSRLGQGGMGEVWMCRHTMLARRAAVKVIRADAIEGGPVSKQSSLARFEREARATSALKSPHTVHVYDFGIADDGTFYYVLEHKRRVLPYHDSAYFDRVIEGLRRAGIPT